MAITLSVMYTKSKSYLSHSNLFLFLYTIALIGLVTLDSMQLVLCFYHICCAISEKDAALIVGVIGILYLRSSKESS
jgi:hypothetical protein